MLDGLTRDLLDDPTFRAIVRRDLETGEHVNDTDNPAYFTTAYLHRPDELAAELGEGGFELVDLVGVEGPTWMYADAGERFADAQRREHWLDALRALEREPSLLGMSAHLLAVGRAI